MYLHLKVALRDVLWYGWATARKGHYYYYYYDDYIQIGATIFVFDKHVVVLIIEPTGERKQILYTFMGVHVP